MPGVTNKRQRSASPEHDAHHRPAKLARTQNSGADVASGSPPRIASPESRQWYWLQRLQKHTASVLRRLPWSRAPAVPPPAPPKISQPRPLVSRERAFYSPMPAPTNHPVPLESYSVQLGSSLPSAAFTTRPVAQAPLTTPVMPTPPPSPAPSHISRPQAVAFAMPAFASTSRLLTTMPPPSTVPPSLSRTSGIAAWSSTPTPSNHAQVSHSYKSARVKEHRSKTPTPRPSTSSPTQARTAPQTRRPRIIVVRTVPAHPPTPAPEFTASGKPWKPVPAAPLIRRCLPAPALKGAQLGARRVAYRSPLGPGPHDVPRALISPRTPRPLTKARSQRVEDAHWLALHRTWSPFSERVAAMKDPQLAREFGRRGFVRYVMHQQLAREDAAIMQRVVQLRVEKDLAACGYEAPQSFNAAIWTPRK